MTLWVAAVASTFPTNFHGCCLLMYNDDPEEFGFVLDDTRMVSEHDSE